jgi:ABC-type enterochelin transport system permease subunit
METRNIIGYVAQHPIEIAILATLMGILGAVLWIVLYLSNNLPGY